MPYQRLYVESGNLKCFSMASHVLYIADKIKVEIKRGTNRL